MVDNTGPTYPPNALYWSAKWWTTTVLSINRMYCTAVRNGGQPRSLVSTECTILERKTEDKILTIHKMHCSGM